VIPPEYTAPDLELVGEAHVRRYQETGGEVGAVWNGVPILLLTTTGRSSGLRRTSALIFARHGHDYLVVASMGGAPRHPSWYLNLVAQPEADVQIEAVRARTATEEEKPGLWQVVAAQWPNYDTYQSRTERDIPVVILSPGDPAPS
jgi:deazaflavin-dependent oxidoreductase (nitroreductase family)